MRVVNSSHFVFRDIRINLAWPASKKTQVLWRACVTWRIVAFWLVCKQRLRHFTEKLLRKNKFVRGIYEGVFGTFWTRETPAPSGLLLLVDCVTLPSPQISYPDALVSFELMKGNRLFWIYHLGSPGFKIHKTFRFTRDRYLNQSRSTI